MKKIFTLFLLALAAFTAQAESTVRTFTNTLKVTVDGIETSQQATVEVEMLEDNLINFVLPNFALGTGDDALPVGNIEINNLYLRDKGSYSSFSYNANLQIKAGSTPGVETWLGPELGNLPLALTGKMSADDLFVNIDLNLMEILQQIVNVQFGTDFAPAKATGEKTFTATANYGLTAGGQSMTMDPVEGYAAKVVYNDNKTFDLCLDNLILSFGGETMTFGAVAIPGIDLDEQQGYNRFSHTARVDFTEGTAAADYWMGAGLNIEVAVDGKLKDDALYYILAINAVDQLGGTIVMEFGTDFAPATPAGAAKVYNDQIVVSVNDYSTDAIPASVEVTPLSDGGINFTLKNFQMTGEDLDMKVGNISIEDLALYEGPGYKYFNYTGSIFITPGNEVGVAEDEWIGPMLGQIPLRMRGRITDDKLYVTIDIDMVELGQVIFVTFGSKIDPVVGPTAGEKSGIYLRGSFNGWGATDEAEFLTTSVAGVYEIKDLTFANGSDGFKVADANWGDINFGGNGALTIGQPYTLVAGGGNIKLPTDNEYKCSVITLDMNTKTLTIVGEEGGKVVETIDFVSLAGTPEFIGAEWDPTSDAGRMSETTNVAAGGNFRTFEWSKLGVPAGEHQFKFTANGAWEINWGAASCAFDAENGLVRGGDNAFFTLSESADIKVELSINSADLSNGKFTIKKITFEGIETIVAEGSVSLIYDLQGRRVRNASGLHIVNGKTVIR